MKNISECFIEALKLISERYRIHNIKWILIGSSSLALNGVDVLPNDIDILTDKKGALKSNKIFEEFMIKKVEWSETKVYKSYFGKFIINNSRVEIMGDLWVNNQGKWKSLAPRLENPPIMSIEDFRIPITRLADHLETYRNSVLKKKQKKYSLILKRVKELNKIKRY